jgi:hypothetical protein
MSVHDVHSGCEKAIKTTERKIDRIPLNTEKISTVSNGFSIQCESLLFAHEIN